MLHGILLVLSSKQELWLTLSVLIHILSDIAVDIQQNEDEKYFCCDVHGFTSYPMYSSNDRHFRNMNLLFAQRCRRLISIGALGLSYTMT